MRLIDHAVIDFSYPRLEMPMEKHGERQFPSGVFVPEAESKTTIWLWRYMWRIGKGGRDVNTFP
jgi:hypothetical protein